jgi:hypothetical protein
MFVTPGMPGRDYHRCYERMRVCWYSWPASSLPTTDPSVRGDFDRAVGYLGPDLMMCTKVSARGQDHVPNWVDPYWGCEARSAVNVTVEQVHLYDPVAIVDRPALSRRGAPWARGGARCSPVRIVA